MTKDINQAIDNTAGSMLELNKHRRGIGSYRRTVCKHGRDSCISGKRKYDYIEIDGAVDSIAFLRKTNSASKYSRKRHC